MFLEPVDEKEVENAIKNRCKVKKSCGFYNSNVSMLKKIIDVVLEFLSKIINISFSTGLVTAMLKHQLLFQSSRMASWNRSNIPDLSHFFQISLSNFKNL